MFFDFAKIRKSYQKQVTFLIKSFHNIYAHIQINVQKYILFKKTNVWRFGISLKTHV